MLSLFKNTEANLAIVYRPELFGNTLPLFVRRDIRVIRFCKGMKRFYIVLKTSNVFLSWLFGFPNKDNSLKKNHCSIFSLSMLVLKLKQKFGEKGIFHFLPNHTIKIAYAHSFFFTGL